MAMTGLRGRPSFLPEEMKRKRDRMPEILKMDDLPSPPEDFNESGLHWWNIYGTILKRRQVLSPDFMPALECLCRLHQDLAKAEAIIEQDGIVILDKGRRPLRQHPLLIHVGQLRSAIRSYQCDFGLTLGSIRALGGVPKAAKTSAGVISRDKVKAF